MPHAVETMMYVGETPWHKLGTKLATPPATTLEALQAGGANFDIALRPLYIDLGPDPTLGKLQIEDAQAIYRVQDGEHFGVVGKSWHCIQPRDAVKPIDPLLESGAARIETCGSLWGGRKIWMLAKLALEDSVIVPKADDVVQKHVLIALGNDGTMGLRIGLTPIRVVCWNTLSAALSYGEQSFMRIAHWKNARSAIDAVTETIRTWDAQFNLAADAFRLLAGVRIKNEEQLREYVTRVFAPAKREAAAKAAAEQIAKAEAEGRATFAALLQKSYTSTGGALDPDQGLCTKETRSRIFAEVQRLFEGGRGAREPGVAGTAWGAYNAVTELCNWKRGRTDDGRMESVWLNGAADNPSRRALPEALATFLS